MLFYLPSVLILIFSSRYLSVLAQSITILITLIL